jgi:CheY-like chemotaxis protein/anti-sigma regulatory factor (Ser/Thr protein kinase)
VLTLDVAPVNVEADPVRMEQVIGNLLTNAAKYTTSDGAIAVALREHRGVAELVVSDNGMGISEAMLPHVFDLFVQGERPADRRQAGMGLGLALVRRLVELHGGTVVAASDGVGRGSTFTVRLPCEAGEAAGPHHWRGRHTLIVAPPDATPLDTATALSAAGCRVTLSVAAGRAADQVAEDRPDLVLIDVSLPGATSLRSATQSAGVPTRVIGIAPEGWEAAGDSFDAVLSRPIGLGRLRASLQDDANRASLA